MSKKRKKRKKKKQQDPRIFVGGNLKFYDYFTVWQPQIL